MSENVNLLNKLPPVAGGESQQQAEKVTSSSSDTLLSALSKVETAPKEIAATQPTQSSEPQSLTAEENLTSNALVGSTQSVATVEEPDSSSAAPILIFVGAAVLVCVVVAFFVLRAGKSGQTIVSAANDVKPKGPSAAVQNTPAPKVTAPKTPVAAKSKPAATPPKETPVAPPAPSKPSLAENDFPAPNAPKQIKAPAKPKKRF